ncbi:hypothetical protein GCM10023235_09180 [Kitasatospora terrestris]|uniref:Uncharacterized protein n=1 Tax=Kitasatospora terrestris TaxID=258051 RepID=A0ABP9DBA4_9ACTN
MVNPGAGSAETRQTALAPYRTVTCPPSDFTVYTPGPPGHEPGCSPPCGVGVAVPEGVGTRVFVGDGPPPALGGPPGVALDGAADGGPEGTGAADGLCATATADAAAAIPSTAVPIPSAPVRTVGGTSAVESTTKPTAKNTAVTAKAVQQIQTSR